MFGGLLIILFFVLIALAVALATQFWYIAIPLFLLCVFGLVKREQRRQRPRTPTKH